MKKAIFALAVAALGCGSLGAQNYLIEGTAADMDGKKVYIGELRSKKDIFYADSTIIENGQFKLTGKLDSIKPLSIFIGRKHQAFLLDENPIKVSYTTTTQEFMGKQIKTGDIKVTGDKDQQLLAEMNNALTQEMYTMLAISFMGQGKDVNAPENKALADSTNAILASLGYSYKVTASQVASVSNGVNNVVMPSMKLAADGAVAANIQDPNGPFADLFA